MTRRAKANYMALNLILFGMMAKTDDKSQKDDKLIHKEIKD